LLIWNTLKYRHHGLGCGSCGRAPPTKGKALSSNPNTTKKKKMQIKGRYLYQAKKVLCTLSDGKFN
jgi:hypothetical protein